MCVTLARDKWFEKNKYSDGRKYLRLLVRAGVIEAENGNLSMG
jgi:hypothetical protein